MRYLACAAATVCTLAAAVAFAEPMEVFPGVRLDRDAGYVEFDGTVPIIADAGDGTVVFLELMVCIPDTKEHEALVMAPVKPSHVHAALLALGLEPEREQRGVDVRGLHGRHHQRLVLLGVRDADHQLEEDHRPVAGVGDDRHRSVELHVARVAIKAHAGEDLHGLGESDSRRERADGRGGAGEVSHVKGSYCWTVLRPSTCLRPRRRSRRRAFLPVRSRRK